MTTKKTKAEIAAQLTAQDQKEKNKTFGGDGASYPFWSMGENATALIRFLPDKDDTNDVFWIERQTIKLPFDGIVNGDPKPLTISVPCVAMFPGRKVSECPITQHIKEWWNDQDKRPLAAKYYKKKSYVTQGFIVHSPLDEGERVPQNPIRRFVLNPSIYEIVKGAVMNPDIEEMPCDFLRGRDFKLSKTKKGEYANYSTSQWSFKERALDDAERSAVETYGLNDLSTFRGRNPDKDELAAIYAMFLDSLAGKEFDTSAYGQWFKPYGSPEVTPVVAPAEIVTPTQLVLPVDKKQSQAEQILREIQQARNTAA